MAKVLIDTDTWKILEVDGVPVKQECIRCGECCRQNVPNCEHYSEDSVLPRCKKQGGWKPVNCVVWPFTDKMPEGCGYREDM